MTVQNKDYVHSIKVDEYITQLHIPEKFKQDDLVVVKARAIIEAHSKISKNPSIFENVLDNIDKRMISNS